MRVTIKQIAEELGINHSTVSRVLNDKQSHLVSAATRERTIQTADRMGYRPSRIAQALQGKKTNLIGVFLPDEEDEFLQEAVRSLRHTVEESGYELMIFASPPDRIAQNWHRLLQWDLDGAFVFDYMFYVDGLSEALTKHMGYVPPIVGLFSQKTQLADYVTVDFAPAVEALLTHLSQLGCRRYGYMALPTSFTPAEQRFHIYSSFVASHGFERIDMPLPPASTIMEAARECVATWIADKKPLPDALFCQNDEIAVGAYKGLHDAGIRVPADLMLAGCDNVPFVAYFETPLTTITLPVNDVCRTAWSILHNRLSHPEAAPTHVSFPAKLKLRESTSR
jgi:LacI family transcriptional regulator